MSEVIYENYVITGDVITIAICMVSFFLITSSYIKKSKTFYIFRVGVITLTLATIFSIAYHLLLSDITANKVIYIYFFREAHYICLLLELLLFNAYLIELVDAPNKKRKYMFLLSTGLFFFVLEILTPITRIGFYIDENLQLYENYNNEIFRIFYCFYVVVLFFDLLKFRKIYITKVIDCLLEISALSFIIMAVQSIYYETTYVCATFLLPIISVLFLMHYSSYDVDTWTLDIYTFKSYLNELIKKNKKFTVFYFYLDDFSLKSNMFKMLQNEFYHKLFKKSYIFKLSDNRIALVCSQSNFNKKVDLYKKVDLLYDKYKINYKINIVKSNELLKTPKDYILLNEFVENKIKINEKYVCEEQDFKEYVKLSYIVNELEDIANRNNLNDERVLVYCQPVLNVKENIFDSAESLMRLNLPNIGLVYPNIFIPLAEKYGYIHILSKIILNKTCEFLEHLSNNNKRINRISVNFSVQELKEESFCDDIIFIIKKHNIPYSKIAIELTESKTTKDFELVKNGIEILKQYGIKFYLDDFGTGYSNFERIMKLPIDIIKFDMNMVSMMNKNKCYEYMVNNFANIFKTLGYSVLFEGVETKLDEEHCKDMLANYLQGYLYSKPIPIENLLDYLEKNN